MEDFDLNKDQIVAPPQSKIACHHGPKEADDHPLLVFSGRKVKTLTVGKMPNRQIQIYDKRQEVISRRKFYWFDVRGTDRSDKAQQVWRIEVRAGKSHLLRWGLRSFQDIEDSFGDLVIRALEDVRYLADDQNYETVNVSRAKLHPLWRAVQDAAFQALFESRSGLCPGTIRNQLRYQMINDSRKLFAAHARRFGVALGLTNEQIIEDLPKIVSDSLAHDIDQDPETFVAKAQAIQEKVRFIEDERFDIEEYQEHIQKSLY